MTVETNAITVREVSELAQALTDSEALEKFVMELDPDRVPLYLARLVDASTNIRALTTGLERRLLADGRVGEHFIFDGRKYGFFGAQRKGYDDMPGLFAFLIASGISAVTLATAVSDARVTDLRMAASAITDPEKRDAALAEIDAHRIEKGDRGAPRFQEIEDRFAFTARPTTTKEA